MWEILIGWGLFLYFWTRNNYLKYESDKNIIYSEFIKKWESEWKLKREDSLKHYSENWNECNIWLQENAPEYVLKCLDAVHDTVEIQNRFINVMFDQKDLDKFG